MSAIYNQTENMLKRQELRRNMPRAELLLWSKLRGRQICGLKFRRQFGVGLYIVDFYCQQIRLAIELDGDSHSGEAAVKYDKKRQDEIERIGVAVLRIGNLDVFDNLDGVVEGIGMVCVERLRLLQEETPPSLP